MILVENQIKFIWLRQLEIKKAKATKKCVIKRKLKFENHKDCLEATKLDNNINIKKKMKLP